MSTKLAPATQRQLEYIKRLQQKLGKKREIKGKLSSAEASRLIGDLVSGLKKESAGNFISQKTKINEPHLGMAMKECFRLWKQNGWDIYEKHRNAFINDAVDTYMLFTEIAEKVDSHCQD